MPEFYIKIARKFFARILGGHVPPCLPVSYAYESGTNRKLVYDFYRAMHFSAFARSWDRMSSVCPSVRL